MIDPLDRLLAVEDIRRLKATYFRAIDSKDWDALATLFTPDAIFDLRAVNSMRNPLTGELVPALGDETMVHRGRDAVLAMVRASIGKAFTVHHGHLGEIELADIDHATGVWAMEDIVRGTNPDRPVRFHGYGHYHDRYIRTAQGWQISESRITRLLLD